MSALRFMLPLFFGCACARETLPPLVPVQSGTHHFFSAEKRGACFGDMDRTPFSPELNHWNRTLGTHRSSSLAAWSRDIARGQGCDEHRFNVVQAKSLFDLSQLPRGAVVESAEFVARLVEVATPSLNERRARRYGELDEGSCRSGEEYFAEVGVTDELVLGASSTGAMMSYQAASTTSLPDGVGGARQLRADVTQAVNRILLARRQRLIGIVVSPRSVLDPQVRGVEASRRA